MKSCFQTKGMSILEHGESVAAYYADLHGYLFNDEPLKYEWKLPEWLNANRDFIKSSLLPLDVTRDYHIFHDCGKPLCVTIDELGKQHFPDHAKASKQRWMECTTETPRNVLIGGLIGMDMDIHLLNAESLCEFSERPEAVSLLITGLCEIHSNAAMFGGIDSTSFKIKYKHINKMGKRILGLINTPNSETTMDERSKEKASLLV